MQVPNIYPYIIILGGSAIGKGKASQNLYNIIMHKFPEVLKELREEKGLSQAQLADKLGYKSGTTIAKWELGERTPELNNLIALAKYFEVTLGYLVGVEG